MNVAQFMHTMQEFLSSLREVYPECMRIRGYELAFRTKTAMASREKLAEIGSAAMQAYSDIMSPWYERCSRKDPSLLSENIKFLHDLELPQKWGGMDADTKDTIWEYIICLNQSCGAPEPEIDIDNLPGMPAEMVTILDAMPESLKLGISATSARYAAKIKNGEMSFSQVNIMQMAKEMESVIKAEDMQAFGQTIKSGDLAINASTLTSMVSQMNPGEMPSGMMSTITGLLTLQNKEG